MSNPQKDSTTSSDSSTPADSTSARSSSATTTGGTTRDDHLDPAPEHDDTVTTGPEIVEGEDDEPKDGEPEDGDARLRREAKRHRLRLREVEAERDTLHAKLQATVTSVVDEKLKNIAMTSRVLRLGGADLDGLIDAEGGFDDAGLLNMVNAMREELGLPEDQTAKMLNRTYERFGTIDWSRSHWHGYVPSAGTGGEQPLHQDDWQSVIRDR